MHLHLRTNAHKRAQTRIPRRQSCADGVQIERALGRWTSDGAVGKNACHLIKALSGVDEIKDRVCASPLIELVLRVLAGADASGGTVEQARPSRVRRHAIASRPGAWAHPALIHTLRARSWQVLIVMRVAFRGEPPPVQMWDMQRCAGDRHDRSGGAAAAREL